MGFIQRLYFESLPRARHTGEHHDNRWIRHAPYPEEARRPERELVHKNTINDRFWKWPRKIVSAPRTDGRVRKGFLVNVLPCYLTRLWKDWEKGVGQIDVEKQGDFPGGRKVSSCCMVRVGDDKLFRTPGASCLSKLARCTSERGVCVFSKAKVGLPSRWYLGSPCLWLKTRLRTRSWLSHHPLFLKLQPIQLQMLIDGRMGKEKAWYLHIYTLGRWVGKFRIRKDGK